jgi:hypothetical protein
MSFIAPKAIAFPITDITFSTGILVPSFNECIYEYDLYVLENTENIEMTLHLSLWLEEHFFSINDGEPIQPIENENLIFELALQPGENVFNLNWGGNGIVWETFTFTVKRYNNNREGWTFNFISYNEISTNNFTITVTDPITNSEIIYPIINRGELEYELATDNFSGNLLLNFKETNDSIIREANLNVNAHSIYRLKLYFDIFYTQGGVNIRYSTAYSPSNQLLYTIADCGGYFTIRIDYNSSGQISSTSLTYNRHSNLVIGSENGEMLSIYDINNPGTISNMTVSDILVSVNELTITPTINIFPNPTNDFLIVSGLTDETLNFYTISGQLLFTHKAIAETEKINISHLPVGVYFVKTNNGQMLKWIKK